MPTPVHIKNILVLFSSLIINGEDYRTVIGYSHWDGMQKEDTYELKRNLRIDTVTRMWWLKLMSKRR